MGWIRRRPERPSPWRAGYRGPDGREHSKAFERKVDAERWLRTELQKQDLGIWVDPEAGTISFEEWSAIWMSGRVGLTEKTLASGIKGSSTAGSFPPSVQYRSRRWLVPRSRCGSRRCRPKGSAPPGFAIASTFLAACLDAAMNEGLIGRNPARGVELPARPVDVGHRYLTAEQVDRLASAATSIADHSLILTLAYGGLRWGEAVALRRGQVDVLRRRLSIAEAATEVSGRLVFGEPKTHRRRPSTFQHSLPRSWPSISTTGHQSRRPWCGQRLGVGHCAQPLPQPGVG